MMVDEFDALSRRLSDVLGARWVLLEDALTRRYTVDWTSRRGPHRAIVVRPGCADDVALVLAACAQRGVPLVPQGGNTGLVEGSVPAAAGWVVLSTERLTSIEDLDTEAGQVTVGAGVTLAALAASLDATGWRFAVDLAARDSATIGGIIATNAGGLGVFRHGSTRAQLLGVQAALSTGVVIDQRRHVDKDNTGYDLSGLLCGSEGTLAVVTSARLRLVPASPCRVAALVGYGNLPDAFAAAWQLRRHTTSAEVIEVLGPGCIDLVAQHDGVSSPWGSGAADAQCALLVDVAGDDSDELAAALAEAITNTAAIGDAVAITESDRSRLYRFREGLTDVLNPRDPLKLDVSIPAADMARFCDDANELVRRTDSDATLFVFGHVCDHNLHLNVVGLAATQRTDVEAQLLRRVVAIGGSISAEHGIGRRRASQLSWARSSEELALFAAVKAAWDPAGVLNPGVLAPG